MNQKKPFLRVVGIGSSAGGLEALRILTEHLPKNSPFCYLVAQHLSPHHRSMLAELLARDSNHLKFVEADSGMKLAAQTVYITPPNHDLVVDNGTLQLTEPEHEIGPKPSVDHLFLSLAQNFKEYSIGIILSGTGSDGAHGIRAIKAHGGFTFVQSPNSAKYDGMPHAAIQGGDVDFVLPPDEIAKQLHRLVLLGVKPKIPDSAPKDAITEILNIVHVKHKINFLQYKESTIHRQLARRMATQQISSVDDYLAYIKDKPAEIDHLYRSFLISVTEFFRDQEAWEGLKSVLRDRLKSKDPKDPIRVWVAGCATGEEAYSMAIVLSELINEGNQTRQVKIFATDIDHQALESARKGIYAEATVQALGTSICSRYFTHVGRFYRVTKVLRDMIVFAQHDLTGDPAFFNLDLISCRNVFIYMTPTLQSHLIQVFHHALDSKGLLFLGQSESLDDKSIYRKTAVPHLYKSVGERQLPNKLRMGGLTTAISPNIERQTKHVKDKSDAELAHDLIIRNYAPISILVDSSFKCLHYFGPIEEMLTISSGSANLNLNNLLPPDLRVPTRGLVSRVAKESQDASLILYRNESSNGADTTAIRCVVRKVYNDESIESLFLVSFEKVETEVLKFSPDIEIDEQVRAHTELLERDLADTRENLQAIIEEMETSNEELQSLNEEMQANSEELQSANEQLQTTNEELQSSNEELQTVNQELQVRTSELASTNSYLENIQEAIDLALIVVDEDIRVQRFTPSLTKLFEILLTDIGRPLSTLKTQLDIGSLEQNIRAVMENTQQYKEQMTHDGTKWLLTINPYFDGNHIVSGAVLSFTDISVLSAAQHDLAIRTAALEVASDGMVIVDLNLKDQPIIYASQAFCNLTGYAKAEIIGKNCRFLQGDKTKQESIKQIRKAVDEKRSLIVELLNYRKDGTEFWNELRLSPLIEENGDINRYVGLQADITDRKNSEISNKRRANYDALTGLANRTLLINRLKRVITLAEKHRTTVYLLFIDLDGFKDINDTLGHSIGDQVLIQASERLRKCLRENDTIARFGGDEFVIVLPDITSVDAVIRLTNSLLSQMRSPFKLLSNNHRLSASIGISAYPADSSDADELIQHADTAMYKAKNGGRDGFTFFQSEMNDDAVERSATKQAIYKGLEKGQFKMSYQPIVDVSTSKIVGAEGLIRWEHPERGLTLPHEFIPIAEDTGQIIPLGNWVLEQAIKQIYNWRDKLSPEFRLAINISAKQLHDKEFQKYLSKLPNSILKKLEFEITESAFIDKNPEILKCISMIRSKGGKISLDDFGTGYSSFQFLLDYKVDALKIERGFFR